jgi:hypothetical protein
MRSALSILLKLFLLAVIPILTLGFNVFEKTALYSSLFRLKGAESAISEKLTTQYGDPKKLVVERDDSPEFEDLFSLIRQYTAAKLPDGLPDVITRLGVDNGTSVMLPGERKLVILIPESVPIYCLYGLKPKFPATPVSVDKQIRIGSVGDLKAWVERRRRNIRSWVDIAISITSIILGLVVEFALPKDSTSQ